MAVGAGQPHVEFRLGWSGLIAQAAESMRARLVIDELTVASRRPVVCTLQLPEVSAAAEGQERDLEEGFTDPQRWPQVDQGAGSMCRLCECAQHTPQPLRHLSPCVPCWRRQSTLLQARPKDVAAQPGRCLLWQLEKELDHTG